MILEASQRGHGALLARHLLNERENDHVEVLEMHHMAAQDLHGGFREIEAVASATKATQPFFHVSIDPPNGATITDAQFLDAVERIEQKTGLTNHARAVVVHEKEGRRHAHAIWSRIDDERMTAVNMGHFKLKLQDVSRDLYREHSLEMPEGFKDKGKRDPLNYDREAWQQAERIDEDPRELKSIITDAYQHSDSAKAFAANLEEHALMLARGDKRGFVVVHHSGEALPLHRYLGLKLGETKHRLGKPEHLITVDQAREQLRDRMTAAAERRIAEIKARHRREREPFRQAVAGMKATHREQRDDLQETHRQRQEREALQRAERLRKGLHGFWQRLTGERGRIVRQNEAEQRAALARDRAEKHGLISRQLVERRELQARLERVKERQRGEYAKARRELGYWLGLDRDDRKREELRAHSEEIGRRKNIYRQSRRLAQEQREAAKGKPEAKPPQAEAKPERATWETWKARAEERKAKERDRDAGRDEGRGHERGRGRDGPKNEP